MRRHCSILALAVFPCVVVHADCIDDAASRHSVNAFVLRAIGWQESRLNPEAIHRNLNGTTDFGAFQINSIHLRTLGEVGITPQALRNGCVSAYVAAWHYRGLIERHGNTWLAVGAYHSASPALNRPYANDIAAILMSWGVMPRGPLPFPGVPDPRPEVTRARRIGAGPSVLPSSPAAVPADGIVLDASSETAPRAGVAPR